MKNIAKLAILAATALMFTSGVALADACTDAKAALATEQTNLDQAKKDLKTAQATNKTAVEAALKEINKILKDNGLPTLPAGTSAADDNHTKDSGYKKVKLALEGLISKRQALRLGKKLAEINEALNTQLDAIKTANATLEAAYDKVKKAQDAFNKAEAAVTKACGVSTENQSCDALIKDISAVAKEFEAYGATQEQIKKEQGIIDNLTTNIADLEEKRDATTDQKEKDRLQAEIDKEKAEIGEHKNKIVELEGSLATFVEDFCKKYNALAAKFNSDGSPKSTSCQKPKLGDPTKYNTAVNDMAELNTKAGRVCSAKTSSSGGTTNQSFPVSPVTTVPVSTTVGGTAATQ